MSNFKPVSTFSLAGRPVNRVGYGAMQLAGPGVFGPPKDRGAAIAVLREAVASGVNHIDTSDFYGIAYVPFFPLGGFTPIQSSVLSGIAQMIGATPMQVALAWLLHRAPNILLIPGTSSLEHLRENMQATQWKLADAVHAKLDAVGKVHGSRELE